MEIKENVNSVCNVSGSLSEYDVLKIIHTIFNWLSPEMKTKTLFSLPNFNQRS